MKCGLSNNLNDTGGDQIKTKGIKNYTMPSAETEVDTDYSDDLTESDSELESN